MTADQHNNKKRPGESWESFADRRIREAREAGAFDRLPGFGQPIPGIEQPWNENSWIRQKLKHEGINALPPVLEVRREIEKTLEKLPSIGSEYTVRKMLAKLNERIREAHYSHIPGPADGVRPIDVEAAVERWKQQRSDSRQGTGNP